MIYETKQEGKRKLSTMHNIKMAPSWLFPHANAKAFSILTFCIASIPLSTYTHEA
jgi:hypothetical protein